MPMDPQAVDLKPASEAPGGAAGPAIAEERAPKRPVAPRRGLFRDYRRRTEFLGQSFTWLCGGALAFNILLVVAIMLLLAWNGLGYFWQRSFVLVTLEDGTKLLGEVWEEEVSAVAPGSDPEEAFDRLRMKVGNRDVGGLDFVWLDRSDIASIATPEDAVLLERLEWGNFHGFMEELRRGGQVIARGPEEVWRAFQPLHERAEELREEIEELESGPVGDVNYELERLRLAERRLELEEGLSAAERERRRAEIERRIAGHEAEYGKMAERLFQLRDELTADVLVMRTAGGVAQEIPVGLVVRAVRPNRLGLFGGLKLYLSRVGEFVSADPRESNTEGGIFPAIFGTVMMVFLMSFAVAPLGVLAALYLREYARQGPLVRMVRIAVNNLAGVPSIVFGVFGLGFFVYLIGGTIDQLFYPEALPTPTYGTGGILWASLTLALLTVPVVIVAAEEGLAAVPRIVREGSLALGATKFETIRKVVLPAAAPGILTGMILAMARAAGEVAPLMIVGMVKLAPALPLDSRPPFLHLERKFMHLGFHIYDVGFQSPNVEATTPLVFATALLLIVVVTVMNLLAIALRNHLRRKYAGSSV
jgi:phosphate transport system permease protein